jgi:hypothetical protein
MYAKTASLPFKAGPSAWNLHDATSPRFESEVPPPVIAESPVHTPNILSSQR